MSVRSLLNVRRDVWRPTESADGMGGRSVVFAPAGVVRCKVDQPGERERESGGQWLAELTHVVFLLPHADVRRGDELRSSVPGVPALRVLAVVGPSGPRYRKAMCSAAQVEGV